MVENFSQNYFKKKIVKDKADITQYLIVWGKPQPNDVAKMMNRAFLGSETHIRFLVDLRKQVLA